MENFLVCSKYTEPSPVAMGVIYDRMIRRMSERGFDDLGSDMAMAELILIMRQMHLTEVRDPAAEHNLRNLSGVRQGRRWKQSFDSRRLAQRPEPKAPDALQRDRGPVSAPVLESQWGAWVRPRGLGLAGWPVQAILLGTGMLAYRNAETSFSFDTFAPITIRRSLKVVREMAEARSAAGGCEISPGSPSLEALGRALIHLPHPVVVHRLGIILWANNAAAEIVGAPSPDAVVGLDSLQFVAPEQREFARERQVVLLRDGVLPGSSVLKLLRFDGSELFGEAKAALMDWEGEPAACMVLWDITARYEAERQLAWEATHDTLTSLANRRGVLDHLAAWSTEPSADGSGVGVIVADLDGFKDVNDTLGHDCGDRVLVEVAERLRQLADGHLVGRFGGDEFIVCVRGSLAEVLRLAEAIAAVTVALRAAHDGEEVAVAPSVGAAWCQRGTAGWHVDQVIIAADHAMYRAKRDQIGWVVDDLSAHEGNVGGNRAPVTPETRSATGARRRTDPPPVAQP